MKIESKHDARREDATRAKLLRADAVCRAKGRSRLLRLSRGLSVNASGKNCRPTLASAVFMRRLRKRLIKSMVRALAHRADLAVATLVNINWIYSRRELRCLRASTLKAQFRTHLNRTGVTQIPGPLIGFVHGEWDSTAKAFQIHFHLVTTNEKAQAIKRLKGRMGYTKTATGAAPIVCQALRDPAAQLSYLFKSFWPERPIVVVDGRRVRRRGVMRIRGRAHSEYLSWLHKQRLEDMMVLNGVLFRGGKFKAKKEKFHDVE